MGSILSGAVIVVLLCSSSLVGSREDHAVTVSYGDATPFTSGNLVHHVYGRNHEPTGGLEQTGADVVDGFGTVPNRGACEIPVEEKPGQEQNGDQH